MVGVLRADFRFPSGDKLGPLNQFPKHAEIFKPMGFNWAKLGRLGQFNFAALVRLRAGVNPARAEAEMTASVADAGRDMKIDLSAHLVPLQEQVTGGSRRALTLLLAAVGAVLLIVCVNLGNLMLVRASERARDAAIRRALGAGAGQLFRPIVAESLLIALTGGALERPAGVRRSADPGEYGSGGHSTPRRNTRQLYDAAVRFRRIGRLRHPVRLMAGHPRHSRRAC